MSDRQSRWDYRPFRVDDGCVEFRQVRYDDAGAAVGPRAGVGRVREAGAGASTRDGRSSTRGCLTRLQTPPVAAPTMTAGGKS